MSVADEIRKLDDLRKQGLLSDAEFEQQKQILLSSGTPQRTASPQSASHNSLPRDEVNGALSWADVELKNKWWFQALVTIVIVPIGLILIAFLRSYQRSPQGTAKRVGLVSKSVLAVAAIFLWAINIALLSGPSNLNQIASGSPIPQCDSAVAREALTNAIQHNASSNIATLRLLDVRDVTEIGLSDDGQFRRCNGTLVLNSGSEQVGYVLSISSTGDYLVEIQPVPFSLPAPTPAATIETPETVARFGAAPASYMSFPAQLSPGPHVSPDLNGAQRDYANYRTRIEDAVAGGVNFGGQYAMVEIGCGTGCRGAMAIDLTTGAITNFPLGGEEYPSLVLNYVPASTLVEARYEARNSEGKTLCEREFIVMNYGEFQTVARDSAVGYCP